VSKKPYDIHIETTDPVDGRKTDVHISFSEVGVRAAVYVPGASIAFYCSPTEARKIAESLILVADDTDVEAASN
jgi:hypothetical protein